MALLVGLTGSMGSGKSLVARMFQELGAHLIDADKLCRTLVEPDKPAWQEIVDKFGQQILNEDKTLDRKKMAEIIFNDSKKKQILENILHPRVFLEEKRIYDKIREKENDAIVIVDSPLLIESGNHSKMQKVIVVSCDEDTSLERIMDKGSFGKEDAKKRIKSQMRLQEKLKYADYILENNSSIDNLNENVKSLYQDLKVLAI
ncbi:MAG: dephospho-CoA kinase [Nitrospinales bacterium]